MSAVAVVIPAYNESATIRDVTVRALERCPCVIVVDDGSEDGTAERIAGLPVTVLRHAANQGKAAALWTGIERALADGAQAVITLDADGQHRPEDILRFLEAHRTHPDCLLLGARQAVAAAPRHRYYANRVADFWISWACGTRVVDSQCGFRLYPAALLHTVEVPHDKPHGFVFESEILIEAARRGLCLVSVPVAALYPPLARPSHFRAVLDVLRIARMVAWKLVSRGLYPQGFFRAFLRPRARATDSRGARPSRGAG